MAAAVSAPQRLRREDCNRTKHDSIFSKWQVLIGPSDWEDYTLRKDGSERYRIHNLPISSCPGIYELGVAATSTDGGREVRKVDKHQIVVVYVGQADNVRTRLQHYGRAGSHLDHGNSVSLADKNDSFHRGPGLFKEIFAKGFSIVYRWAPMKSKKEAENAERLLLRAFDYAWNRVTNGSCRRDDVLLKLKSISLVANPFTGILRKLQFFKIQTFNRKRVGIRIETGGPLEGVIEYSNKRDCDQSGIDDTSSRICGVTMSDGYVCRNIPVSGRKRCLDHKGMRIKTSRSGSTVTKNCLLDRTDGKKLELVDDSCNVRHAITVCGVALEDGSVCTEVPSDGRKRCQMHKGRRISKSQFR